MSQPERARIDASRVEKKFSSLQPVHDVVQVEHSAVPACCLRTGMVIGDGSARRTYALALPLRSHKPNETPERPPQNRKPHVMTGALSAPFFQMLAATKKDGHAFAEVTVEATGPAECPPGQTSRVVLSGAVTGSKDIPFPPWTVAVPSALPAGVLDAPDVVLQLHPFAMPGLPGQILDIKVPGCEAVRLAAQVAVFPDVRWSGGVEVRAEPVPDVKKGFEIKITGDLACQYIGRKLEVTSLAQALALCPWFKVIEQLAKSLVAVNALAPGRRYQGLDNPRLAKSSPLSWDPWPNLRLEVAAALVPQVDNGLLGHTLRYVMGADPLVGARGELSLLPGWLDSPLWQERLAPLLIATASRRIEERTQELGLWLTAQGSISINARLELNRPAADTKINGEARGAVTLAIEGRSIREYETIVVRGGAVADTSQAAGVVAELQAPAHSPLPDPRERKCRSLVNFTGYALHSLEKHRPGIQIRALRKVPPGEAVPPLATVLPARNWPGGTEAEEINWCD